MKFLEQLMKIMVTTKFAMASIAGFHIK